MKAQKCIRVCIEYGMSIFDLICELQELQEHYPDLTIYQYADLEFKTKENNDDKDTN